MRWLLGLIGGAVLVVMPASSSACSGDCDGNGVVRIDELVTAVRIALEQSPPSACPAADGGGDGRVTVHDLVRAVNAALSGCPPTPSATATASMPDTATVTATPSPSLVPSTATPSSTVSVTATGQATATTVGEPTTTPTGEAAATATAPASPSSSPTETGVPTPSGTASATATGTATPTTTSSPTEPATPTRSNTVTSTSTSTRTITSVSTNTPTSTRTSTVPSSTTATPSPTGTRSFSPTASATHTRTATATPTGGPLGLRRFSLDPATSAFIAVLAQGPVEATGFTGYLDLQAGVPDAQGRSVINVTGASTYLELKIGSDLICIKPLVPAANVGVVDCDGGTNLGIVIRQDHRLGVVGQNGFTAPACTAAGGTVEPGDFPHPQICNGPLSVEPSSAGDSSAGAVAIAPNPTFGVDGLPVELTFEVGDACSGAGPVLTEALPLISNDVRTEILDADNGSATLVYDNAGEAFSCPGWTHENGPGRLILSFPTLHGAIGGADVINAFVFDD